MSLCDKKTLLIEKVDLLAIGYQNKDMNYTLFHNFSQVMDNLKVPTNNVHGQFTIGKVGSQICKSYIARQWGGGHTNGCTTITINTRHDCTCKTRVLWPFQSHCPLTIQPFLLPSDQHKCIQMSSFKSVPFKSEYYNFRLVNKEINVGSVSI